jgi:hypothetical protein
LRLVRAGHAGTGRDVFKGFCSSPAGDCSHRDGVSCQGKSHSVALRRFPAQGIGGLFRRGMWRLDYVGGLNGFRLPPVMLLPQRLRSLRSLGEPASALRRKPHDNPPADAGSLSPSIPLRACVAPAGPRGRPAGWPQRPSPLTPRILPSQEPQRRNGATAETATNPRPGVPCAPPSPLPHSAPLRTPDRQRLLVRPAANPLNEPMSAVRDADPRFRACRARCSPSAADSPSLNDFGPPLGTRYGPPHTPEGFDARGDNAPLLTNECGSFASSLTAPNGMRATTGGTSVSPGTRSARPGEGDGGRHATAFPESRPASCPAVHVPRPGFFWHSGCAGSACNRTLWPMGARSAPQSKHSIGAAPSLRRASGMWS